MSLSRFNMVLGLIVAIAIGCGGLIRSIHSAADAAETAQQVQTFCTQHGLSRKTGSHTGLCLEELAENIVRFGFRADKKRHDIEVRVVLKKEAVILRIKDDCIPFNPQEWYEMTTPAGNPTKNVGIRLVFGIARHIEYQNMLGLNVLTVILD